MREKKGMSGILRGLDALAGFQQQVFAAETERQERELAALSRRTDDVVYPVWVEVQQRMQEWNLREEEEENKAREQLQAEEQQDTAWPRGSGHLEPPLHNCDEPFWPLVEDTEESNSSGTWEDHDVHQRTLFGM